MTESDDDALNSYLTQNLMNFQLNSPQLLQKTNESDEPHSADSIDSDRFRSISQIFRKKDHDKGDQYRDCRESNMSNKALNVS